MPWKAVIEIASVLKQGGLCFVATHQSWPVHETPWDYWRYTEFAWPTLFNIGTGFAVVATAMGQTARIIPEVVNRITMTMEDSLGYLGSAVIARKVGEAGVNWESPLSSVVSDRYPH